MVIEFDAPLTAGTTLVRDAINSPNYVAGASGWTINQDGSAEFNNLSIRGDGTFGTPGGQRVFISNTGVISIYDSSNNLVGRWSAAQFFVQNVGTGSNAILQILGNSVALRLTPPSVPGFTFSAGNLYGGSSNPSGDGWTILESPSINGGARSNITMFGANGGDRQIQLNTDAVYLNGNFLVDRINAAAAINAGTDMSIAGGRPLGRGTVGYAWGNTDSANVTAETVMLTAGPYNFLNGRAYLVKFGSHVSTSNANGRAGFRIRKGASVAGGQYGYSGIITCQTGGSIQQGTGEWWLRNDTGATINTAISLTLQNLDGGANTATQRVSTFSNSRFVQISDIGESIDYPFANAMT